MMVLFKYEEFEAIPGKKIVKRHYTLRNLMRGLSVDNNNCLPVSLIIEKMKQVIPDFTDKMFDDEIEKLKSSGEVYEPRRGFWAIL